MVVTLWGFFKKPCEKAVLGRKELTWKYSKSGEDISDLYGFILNSGWSSLNICLQDSCPKGVYKDMFVYTA